MKTTFLIVLLGITQKALSQYCTLPTAIKSTSLSYTETSYSEDTPSNFRFFYKVVVECSVEPGGDLDQLHIQELNSPFGKTLAYSWILDSSVRVTGQLDPCIMLEQAPCYSINYFHTDVSQPDLTKAFLASTTNCCRSINSANVTANGNYIEYANPPPPPPPMVPPPFPPIVPSCPAQAFGDVGNGLANFILVPPTNVALNSSPVFTAATDTILSICQGKQFIFPLKAVDPDGDSIAYHFSPPVTYKTNKIGTVYASFSHLFYKDGYSVSQPAGPTVTLDETTGIVSGSLPDTGTYDITVSAVEFRGGALLDSVTQDLYIKSYDCNTLAKPRAILPDSINSCDGFTIAFPNNSTPQNQDVTWNNLDGHWHFGDGDSSAIFKPTHTYQDTGVYHAQFILFPGLYCADTARTTVVVYPYVKAAFSYSDTCSAYPVTFINNSTSSSGKIVSSLWQASDFKKIVDSSTSYNANLVFTEAPKTYKIYLRVGNDKGCLAVDSQLVNIEKSPVPLSFHDTLLSYGATLQLNLDDGNFGVGGSFIWTPAEGLSNPFISNPVLSSNTDMTYYVHVKNQFGCTLNDSFTVKYYKGPYIYVANAFTPNGDGKNDIFKPIYIGISHLKYFRVFNRYGQMVFETNNPSQGWNGNINGEPSPEGAYVWEVSGLDYQGKWRLEKGTVVLMK